MKRIPIEIVDLEAELIDYLIDPHKIIFWVNSNKVSEWKYDDMSIILGWYHSDYEMYIKHLERILTRYYKIYYLKINQ